MRVIGGYLRGKKILDPLDKSTRPLKDLVRESIFNIIEHSNSEFVELNRAKVLDLFLVLAHLELNVYQEEQIKLFFLKIIINLLKY